MAWWSATAGNAACLLPQVATQFSWEAERFLEETCVKAGLEREAWKDPRTRIQAFTAEVFGEAASCAEETQLGGAFSKPISVLACGATGGQTTRVRRNRPCRIPAG